MFVQGVGKNRNTLKMQYKGHTTDAAILQGLTDLTGWLRAQQWACEDGTMRQIERIGIDSNYKTQMVYEFCAGDTRMLLPLKGAVDIGRLLCRRMLFLSFPLRWLLLTDFHRVLHATASVGSSRLS